MRYAETRCGGSRLDAIGRVRYNRCLRPGGGMADASVSKTDIERCVGSNPTPGTTRVGSSKSSRPSWFSAQERSPSQFPSSVQLFPFRKDCLSVHPLFRGFFHFGSDFASPVRTPMQRNCILFPFSRQNVLPNEYDRARSLRNPPAILLKRKKAAQHKTAHERGRRHHRQKTAPRALNARTGQREMGGRCRETASH